MNIIFTNVILSTIYFYYIFFLCYFSTKRNISSVHITINEVGQSFYVN